MHIYNMNLYFTKTMTIKGPNKITKKIFKGVGAAGP